MSTKPTRQQDRGCDQLAQALLLIAEAARLDGRSPLDRASWPNSPGGSPGPRPRSTSTRSSPGPSKQGARRSASDRARPSCSRSIEGEVEPLATLLLSDDEFKALVAKAEEELGEV